ncbi:MAG: helix-turn-helix domain-containing protein [Atopobiaceae bacterium]|nr:helix-turn-helix domain-containing protein [Atopobiaceae bacterium]
MNQYVTGATIRDLRERRGLRQTDLACKLAISDKTVSRWETGKGYPDITLLEPLAHVLGVSVSELISGNAVENTNVAANMMHCKFFVCPVCGNVIVGAGEASISCCGVELVPLEADSPDDGHPVCVERVEDELFVRVNHPMTKLHYISFLAAVSPDRVQLVKLYPESDAQTRFKLACVRAVYYYCNKDGLFCVRPGRRG